MKTSLESGLDKQELEDFRGSFAASKVARKRIAEVLQKKIDSNHVYATSKDRYDSPSWPYLQADSVGYTRAIKEIISLISD